MKAPDKQFIDQVKGILKRRPVVQRLLNLKSEIITKINRIRELSGLIKENRIVIFPSYSRMGNDVALTREMVHEVVKEWLDLYGIVHNRKNNSNCHRFFGRIYLVVRSTGITENPCVT